MAIDTSSMLLKLNPMSAIDTGGLQQLQQMTMERERMRLQREQFEETKRQNERAMEMRRIEEAGAMTRQSMQMRQQREQAEAQKAAELKKQQDAAVAEFTKQNGEGNVEAARAMVPMLGQLGVPVELLGEVNGLPSYRIGGDQRPEMGYPTNDSNPMEPPAGISSTEEAFGRAQAASQYAAETGQAARGPDEPDYTGAVPNNVIDLGAQQAATQSRLNPALSAFISAYPEELRGSAEQTAAGVAATGLPMEKSLSLFKDMRTSPDSLIRAGMENDAAKAAAGVKDERAEWNTGFEQGNTIATKLEIGKTLATRGDLAVVRNVLTNDNKDDDYLAGSAVGRMMGERGATTEGDIARALGTAAMTFIERIKKGFHDAAIGGLTEPQKNALRGVIDARIAADAKAIDDYMENIETGDASPGVVSGRKAYRDILIPKDVRESFEKRRQEKRAKSQQKPAESARFDMQANPEPEPTPSPLAEGDFATEMRRQAGEQGLNADAMLGIVGPESGGNPAAKNELSGASGLMQFLPSIAESMGTTAEAIRKMSAVEQIPYMARYFKERGLTAEQGQDEYYVAVAAGGRFPDGTYYWQKPDETVVYKKGSAGWEDNKSWRPADGGDITVGSIKAYGGAKRKGGDAEAKRARLEELRAKKAGG